MSAALALGAALALAAGAEPARSPQVNYELHCQGCHRPDGSGHPGAVPDLRGQVARFLATPRGRAFLVRVPGVANAPLGDADLAQLMSWLLRRFDPAHVPADFAGFTPDEVAQRRAQPLSKVREERAATLAELPEPPPGGAR